MKKNIITKNITGVVLLAAVIIFCFIFAQESPFWAESTKEKISVLTIDEIEVTIVDEDTIRFENLIKDDDLYYCWIVKNYAEGLTLSSGTSGEPMKNNDVIEFSYEILEKISIQAVVKYDGYIYTSNTFAVTSDGGLVVSDDTTATVAIDEELTRDISDIVSLAFVTFLLAMVALYYAVPKKMQWGVLLAGSILFYLLSGVQYIVFILASSIIAFVVAKNMSARRDVITQKIEVEVESKEKKRLKAKLQKDNKGLLMLALIGTLGVMVIIKYTDFMISNINTVLPTEIELLTLVMPLGLSFYTFMLIAYLIDVYRGKYAAENQYARFLLFISFFPHVSQGPLSRYNEVSSQLREHHAFDYDNFCKSAQRILWGFFVKLVLADRIAVIVDGVYSNYSTQSFVMLGLASLAYSIQIYADFYSSMEIAIGSAQMFGITLQENFMRPYFSTNMPEFWRRWHITLGTWFKDYVFYPISISKKLMKFTVKVRKKYGADVSRVVAAAPPIMGVWILTGLWHGSSWKFVAWGLFHGILILLSTAFSSKVQDFLVKMNVNIEAHYYKILQMIKVFILCTIGRVFFRASTIASAFTIFWRMLTFQSGEMLMDFSGISLEIDDYIILPIALGILLLVSVVQERQGSVRDVISRWNIVLRWMVWFLLIFGTLLLGMYGPGTSPVFIYEAF